MIFAYVFICQMPIIRHKYSGLSDRAEQGKVGEKQQRNDQTYEAQIRCDRNKTQIRYRKDKTNQNYKHSFS